MPQLVKLNQGKVKVEFRRKKGSLLAIGNINIKPYFTNLGASRYVVAGPWTVKKNIDDTMKKNHISEKSIDLSETFNLEDGRKGKWMPAKGGIDEVDFFKVTQHSKGSVHYAVTFINSPEDQVVRLAYGCDYFMKIILNGDTILPKLQQSGPPLKLYHHIDLSLKKGKNELLIKVSSGSLGNKLWTAITNPGNLTIGCVH